MKTTPLRRKKPLTHHPASKRKTPLKASSFVSKAHLIATLAGAPRRAPIKRKPRPKHSVGDQDHLDAVAAQGCIACLMDGNPGVTSCIHHVKRRPDGQKYGYGQRSIHKRVLPLCEGHHQGQLDISKVAFHRNPGAFEFRYGSELGLLVLVDALLARGNANEIPAWDDCDQCAELFCNIHGCDVGDPHCLCPSIEFWESVGVDPYFGGALMSPLDLTDLERMAPSA